MEGAAPRLRRRAARRHAAHHARRPRRGEGSITLALVAFGGSETSTAYAVLLYRVISFWLILAVGWIFIGQLALQVRRGRWTRQALASEVEAGPVAYEPRPGPRSRPPRQGRR